MSEKLVRARQLVEQALALIQDCEVAFGDRTDPYVARRVRRSRRLPARPGGAQHGTRSLYARGCRCDDCTDAEARYSKEYRRRQKSNRS